VHSIIEASERFYNSSPSNSQVALPGFNPVRLKENTKSIKLFLTLLTLLVAGIMAGCSTTAAKFPDVSDNIRKSLDQAGMKDVSVDEDRDKGS